MSDLTGLPEFTIRRLIGDGETARVYHALHEPSGAEVALKVWHERALLPAVLAEMATHRKLSALSDRVVRYVWSGVPVVGRPWLAMDLYECSLDERVAAGRLDLPEVLAVADDLLAGLAAVHDAGYVHRDVKPANVLLRGRRAVLADLGLAVPTGSALTNPEAGTWGFTAPELAGGAMPDQRADVYAAARTIAHAAGAGPRVPAWLNDLLTQAASDDPAERPADAGELRKLVAAGAGTLATGGEKSRRRFRLSLAPGRRTFFVAAALAFTAVNLAVTMTGPLAHTPAAAALQPARPLPVATLTTSTAPAPPASVAPTGVPSAARLAQPPTSTAALPRTSTGRPTATTPTTPSEERTTSPIISKTTTPPVVWPVDSQCKVSDPPLLQTITQEPGARALGVRLDSLSMYGWSSDENGSVVGLLGHFVGNAPAGGELRWLAQADPSTTGLNGTPGDGLVHPESPAEVSAAGCSDQEETLDQDPGAVGLTYRMTLAYVPATVVDEVHYNTEGWSKWSDLPSGVVPISSFELRTSDFLQLSRG